MTARNYRDALLRRWRFIILLALATGLGALIASQFMTHQYRSSAIVQIVASPAAPNRPSVFVSDNLVVTQLQLATDPALLADVAKGYPGLSGSRLSSEVSAARYGSTNLMQISVLDTSPTRAASLANDIAAAVAARQAEIRTQQNAQQLQPLQSQLDTIQQGIESTVAALATLPNTPSNAGARASLKTRLSNLNQEKASLQQTIAQTQAQQALGGFTLQVAQMAHPDFNPVRPVVWGNVVAGVLFGMIAGLLIVLCWEWLSWRSSASDDMLAMFGWPLLATLHQTPIAIRDDDEARKQTTNRTGDAEQYQQIITALRHWDIERPLRSLVIAGLGVEGVAQHVAAQLAVNLAADGERTLLVDANIERPAFANWFHIRPQPGLGDSVADFRDHTGNFQVVSKALQAPATLSAPNLRIVSAGGAWPNPMRVFRSVAMRRLVKALLASGAQRVLYSAPPLLHSGAARVLARRTDGLLLVVDPERLRRDEMQHANTMLARAGIRVLGYVLIRELAQYAVHGNVATPPEIVEPFRNSSIKERP
jgi:Mrp family chromosome partitioning ATPase/capsular polysaccharide biosynthesis protein